MKFSEYQLHPNLMKGIEGMRYETLTDVQAEVIGPIREGKDLIVNAQTGTGKTAAFLIPVIHQMIPKPAGKTRVLILVPTRELASQIDDNAIGLAYHTSVTCASVYGGVPMELQERALVSGCTIVAATPGRLLDHYKYGNWRFDELEVLILDEADRMLDMGFWPDIELIVSRIKDRRQTLLFSATMPDLVAKFANKIMRNPVRIRIGPKTPPASITQSFYPVPPHLKEKLLIHILKETHMRSTIIFLNTKIGANRLGRQLKSSGFNIGVIHGDRTQDERNHVMNHFKHGSIQLLIATDVAARGIDIEGVSHIVNYDIPTDPETYVHRIGRTARADAVGDAYTFYSSLENEYVTAIEKEVGRAIPRVQVPGFEEDHRHPSPSPRHAPRRPSGGRSGRHHSGKKPHKPWRSARS